MTTKAPRRPMSARRFLQMSGTEGYELIDGRPRLKAMGCRTSWVQSHLGADLGEVVNDGRLGYILGSDCPYHCLAHRPEDVRKPDVSFVRVGRFPRERLPVGACTLVPDLIAEVVAPNERVDYLARKVNDFRRAGVPLIWVVLQEERTVTVYRDGKFAGELTDAGELTGDPVLPGFRVKVCDLFPPQPPAS